MQRNCSRFAIVTVIAVFPLLTAAAARGDHLRDAERRAEKVHNQAVEYIRYLRDHVPPSGASQMLYQDAAAMFRSVCELQQSLLLATGQPHEIEQIRQYAGALLNYVEDTRRRVKQLEFELGDESGPVLRDANPFRSQVDSRFGPQVEPLPSPAFHDVSRHDRKDRDRLRSRLDVLEDRLEDLERTLQKVNDELWPE